MVMNRACYGLFSAVLVSLALMLAGCGGDDGGLSADDMARIADAESAAAMAQTDADAAKAEAATAHEEAEAAKADAMKAQEAADAAKAEADAAKMAQAEAPDLDDVWEEIAGAAIEAYLLMQVGTTGPVSVTDLKAAINATAMKYGLSATSAIAYVDENYPQFEQLRRTEVTAALAGLHSTGTLAATRDAVAVVLTGPTGDTGDDAMDPDPADVLTMAWDEIAGEAIADHLMDVLPPRSDATLTHKQLSDQIKATATKYGISSTKALETLDTMNPKFSRLLRSEARAILQAILDAGDLAATEASATTVIADKAAGTIDSLPGALARSASGKVNQAASAVAKKVAAELAKADVLLTVTDVTAAVDKVVRMYNGNMGSLSTTAAINAAVKDALAALNARAAGDTDAETIKAIRVAVNKALVTVYASVEDEDDLPQLAADGTSLVAMPGEDTMTSDVSKAAYIDTLLAMDDFMMVTMGGASSKVADYATSKLTSAKAPAKATVGDGIYTYSPKGSDEFGGADEDATIIDVALNYAEWGIWGVIDEQTVDGNAVTHAFKSFGGGVEADSPTGGLGGSAIWSGSFLGSHSVVGDRGTNEDIAVGSKVSGTVDLTVRFDTEDGLADKLRAMFEWMEGTTEITHSIGGATGTGTIDVRRGSFADTELGGSSVAGDNTGLAESSIEGQFVGSGGEGVVGVVSLSHLHTLAVTGTPASTAEGGYHITGAFGGSRQ